MSWLSASQTTLTCLQFHAKVLSTLQRINIKHPEWKHHKLAWFVHGPGQEGSIVSRTLLAPSTEHQ